MADYSLVPVEHQPDFENVSLVPVDHDPFSADGVTQQVPGQTVPSQPASTQLGQRVQPLLAQTQPQPASSAQPKSTDRRWLRFAIRRVL